ncbi:MAG: hypothetical protein LRY27_02475 [Chitinophagales bacterium]|nr:hypothetical protein [Chitinophagales bacterium]
MFVLLFVIIFLFVFPLYFFHYKAAAKIVGASSIAYVMAYFAIKRFYQFAFKLKFSSLKTMILSFFVIKNIFIALLLVWMHKNGFLFQAYNLLLFGACYMVWAIFLLFACLAFNKRFDEI